MPISPKQAASLASHIRETHGFTPEERARLDAMTDAEIEQAARDDPDAQPVPEAALRRAVAMNSRGSWHLTHVTNENKSLNLRAFKVLSEEEHDSIDQACREIRRFMNSQHVVMSVVLNRNDLLSSIVEFGTAVLNNQINEEAGKVFMLEISRKLANLTSIFRSFTDHFTRLFSHRFGIKSQQFEMWEMNKSKEYDDVVAYRVFYVMRNYIQHYDMPPILFHTHQQADVEGATIRIDLDFDVMMEDPLFRKKIGNKHTEEDRSLLTLLGKWDEAFQRMLRSAIPCLASGLSTHAEMILGFRTENSLGEEGNISPLYVPFTDTRPEKIEFKLAYLPETDARMILGFISGEAWQIQDQELTG